MKLIKAKKEGFSTIMLSVMVSAGVLTTIYFTQKMAVGFLSDLSQSMEEWEKHLVNESSQKLATYLVASNLVLCRKDGWRGKNSKCKWNDTSGVESPSEFNLSGPTDSSDGFSLNGSITVEGSAKRYKVTFDLVDWTDTSMENLIGEIPDYVCRNSNDMSIVTGVECPAYDTLPPDNRNNRACHKNGVDRANTHCEYIKNLDGDYYIVLVKIEVPFTDPASNLQQTYTSLSGIRRPVSMVVFKSIVSGKRCSRSCHVGNTMAFIPDCRDDAIPTPGANDYFGLASKVITVRNEGPGAIYKLSLVNTIGDLTDGSDTVNVTPDIISGSGKEVLFPGETLAVEHFYECPITVRDEIVYVATDEVNGLTHVVRNSMVPFAVMGYRFHVDINPLGSCYTSQGDTLTATDSSVDMVLPTRQEPLSSIDCQSNNVADDTACRNAGGFCQYADIEPRRLVSSPVPDIDTALEQRHTKITIFNSGDGDGGGN